MAELIYWDSDAFLGWLQEEPGKVDLCAGTLERAEAGEVGIITSALTLAEVLYLRGAVPIRQDGATVVRRFFRHSYIRVRNVTRAIAESAQDLVWTKRIRPKDAIHVATALDARVAIVETFDDGLIKHSGQIGDPPLTVRNPQGHAQGRLFPYREPAST